MKVSQLLEHRKHNWQELERLCAQIKGRSVRNVGGAQGLSASDTARALKSLTGQ